MFCVSLCEWMAQMYGLVYLKEHLPEKWFTRIYLADKFKYTTQYFPQK